ncbi:MAG: hypothetical protein LBM73_03890 [Candidatus Nomurabacteria bacterium]|jgi:hypothetical protein|nr:hypothetical protein [Candidatus Nomurabacteria bacterium]
MTNPGIPKRPGATDPTVVNPWDPAAAPSASGTIGNFDQKTTPPQLAALNDEIAGLENYLQGKSWPPFDPDPTTEPEPAAGISDALKTDYENLLQLLHTARDIFTGHRDDLRLPILTSVNESGRETLSAQFNSKTDLEDDHHTTKTVIELDKQGLTITFHNTYKNTPIIKGGNIFSEMFNIAFGSEYLELGSDYYYKDLNSRNFVEDPMEIAYGLILDKLKEETQKRI